MEPYNLPELMNKSTSHTKIFKDLMMKHYHGEDDFFNEYLSLLFAIQSLLPSYIAPAYHINQYIKLQNSFFDRSDGVSLIDDTNMYSITNHVYIQVEFHSALYSIKMLLDRMVALFASYYKGVSLNSTFGRINAKGKASGFMSMVIDKHKDDPFLNYVLQEYNSWIKDIVVPRDIITHHHDLPVGYRMKIDRSFEDAFTSFQPVHFLTQGPSKDGQTKTGIEVDDLRKSIDALYNFFEQTMNWFSNDVLPTRKRKEKNV